MQAADRRPPRGKRERDPAPPRDTAACDNMPHRRPAGRVTSS